MLVKENLNDILKGKSTEEIIDKIGDIKKFIKTNLRYPPDYAGDIRFHELTQDIKINNNILKLNFNTFGESIYDQLEMFLYFDVNLKNGEYYYKIIGFSSKSLYSDFYYYDTSDGIITSFYINPKLFINELQAVIDDLAMNKLVHLEMQFDEFKENELNESIILPDKNLYNKMIEVFFNSKKTYDPFTYINDELRPEMELVDFQGHLDNLHPAERKMLSHSNQIPELGIRIYGFDPDTNRVILFVDKSFDDKLLEISDDRLKELLDFMWSGIGHENIHQQQVSRMKKVQNPKFKSREDYFKNKQEIMAHAFSFVQELKEMGISKEGILKNLRSSNYSTHPIKNNYLSIGGNTLKLFIKYAVQYVEKLY